MCGLCNVLVCVCVDYVMRVCECGGLCNASVCVCVDYVKCWCVYVWIM